MVEKASPLNPLYDDVARLRIVRAHLREVNPAVKTGNFAKARDSFKAFDASGQHLRISSRRALATPTTRLKKGWSTSSAC